MITLNSLQNYKPQEQNLRDICDVTNPQGLYLYNPGAPYHGIKIYKIRPPSKANRPLQVICYQNDDESGGCRSASLRLRIPQGTLTSDIKPNPEPINPDQPVAITLVEMLYRKIQKHYLEPITYKEGTILLVQDQGNHQSTFLKGGTLKEISVLELIPENLS